MGRIFPVFLIIVLFLTKGCTTDSNPVFNQVDIDADFVIIGDRTGGHIANVYDFVIQLSLTAKPEFLIDVGDMIEGYTTDQKILSQQWLEYMKIISVIPIPFYHTPGNHDLYYKEQMDTYLQYIGDPYYSFEYDQAHIIVLDNSRWTIGNNQYIDTTQYNWLQNDLDSNTQQFTFVFCHVPFWDYSISDSFIVNNSFHDLLVSKSVDVVVAGHYHNFFDTYYDGIRYIIAGRSGGASTLRNGDFSPNDIRYTAPSYEYHRFLSVILSDSIEIRSHIVM